MTLALPTVSDLCALIKSIKRDIPRRGDADYDSYRCISIYEMDDDTTPATIDLTIGWTPYDGWGYQTGDNSYTGGAYGHPVWAMARIARQDNARAIARELINDLQDGLENWTEIQKEYNK